MESITFTAPATHVPPDLSHVTEEALDAFWDVVTDAYPLARTGDLKTVNTGAFDAAALRAVEEWVRNNPPSAA